jgi:hypothetical protein
VDHRALQAEQFLDGRREQRVEPRPQPRQGVRTAQQGKHSPAEQVADRVAARVDQQQDEQPVAVGREALTVHLGVDEPRREVVSGAGQPGLASTHP